LAERVETAAAGFLAFGLKRGTSVGVWSLNLPEWRFTQFAAPRPGFLVTIRLI
jgi:fatty-acyl-CoA synthase